jgi:hypothetical protein
MDQKPVHGAAAALASKVGMRWLEQRYSERL